MSSNLILTVSLENEEFVDQDIGYLAANFKNHFAQRKRKNTGEDLLKSLYTRVKIQEIGSNMSKELAR